MTNCFANYFLQPPYPHTIITQGPNHSNTGEDHFLPNPESFLWKQCPGQTVPHPCLDYSPGDHCEKPTFTVNSIPVVRHLLTLQMEGWGHKKFPPETCVYIQDLPPIELGKIAEDGFVHATRRPFFMSGQKRRRSPSFSIPSKQPKLQHNLARSSTAICSPLFLFLVLQVTTRLPSNIFLC